MFVLDLVMWLLGFSLLLWILLSLFAGRLVNPLGVVLGVFLAPAAFLIGVFLTGAALAHLAPPLPWLLPLALLVGFFFALFTLAALFGVDIGRTLLALLLALAIMTLLGATVWRVAPFPLPNHL
jgi:hypothetical protein